jgi:hypothetical protein
VIASALERYRLNDQRTILLVMDGSDANSLPFT